MEEPRTHYQISLTARQAVGLFVGLLAALGLAFFFGLMTGLSGRSGPAEEPIGEAALTDASPDAAVLAESVPFIETAVPTAVVTPGSRTELAESFREAPGSEETTPPATLRPFEDGWADESSPVAEASGGKPAPVEPPAAAGTARYWVQVASLSSRADAGSLSQRLSRRGYRSQVLPASVPDGKAKVYRVRVGPFPSETEAQRAAETLRRREKVRAPWVVPEGK